MPPIWVKDKRLYRLATEEARKKHRANVIKDGPRYWKVVKEIYNRLESEALMSINNDETVKEVKKLENNEYSEPEVLSYEVEDKTTFEENECYESDQQRVCIDSDPLHVIDDTEVLKYGYHTGIVYIDTNVSTGDHLTVRVESPNVARLNTPGVDGSLWLCRSDDEKVSNSYPIELEENDKIYILDNYHEEVVEVYKDCPPFGMVIFYWLTNILGVKVSKVVGEDFHYTLKEPDGSKISKAKRRLCQSYKAAVNKG